MNQAKQKENKFKYTFALQHNLTPPTMRVDWATFPKGRYISAYKAGLEKDFEGVYAARG